MANVSDPGPRPTYRIGPVSKALLLSLAAIFDALKFLFATIVFTAPFIAGAVAGSIAADHASTATCWAGAIAVAPVAILVGPSVMQSACDTASSWGATHAQTVGAVVGGATTLITGVLEIVGAPIIAVVEDIGATLAEIIDLMGWIIVGGLLFLIFLMHRKDHVGEIAITAGVSFCFGSLPVLGGLFPTIFPAMLRIISITRKVDNKQIVAWEAKNKAWQREQADQRAAYVAQVQARQIEEQEAQEEYEAANDNEIHDALPAAA